MVKIAFRLTLDARLDSQRICVSFGICAEQGMRWFCLVGLVTYDGLEGELYVRKMSLCHMESAGLLRRQPRTMLQLPQIVASQ